MKTQIISGIIIAALFVLITASEVEAYGYWDSPRAPYGSFGYNGYGYSHFMDRVTSDYRAPYYYSNNGFFGNRYNRYGPGDGLKYTSAYYDGDYRLNYNYRPNPVSIGYGFSYPRQYYSLNGYPRYNGYGRDYYFNFRY